MNIQDMVSQEQYKVGIDSAYECGRKNVLYSIKDIKADIINIADGRQSIKVRSVIKIIDKYISDIESDDTSDKQDKIEPCTSEYQRIYMQGWNDGRKKLLAAMEREIAN